MPFTANTDMCVGPTFREKGEGEVVGICLINGTILLSF